MSDLLKSAMGYFNASPPNTNDNEFVGQIVEVGTVKLRVKRVIAEGLCILFYICATTKENVKKCANDSFNNKRMLWFGLYATTY